MAWCHFFVLRYKQHEDGFYRLLTVRYESVNMTEHAASRRQDSVVAPKSDVTSPIIVQPDCLSDTNVRIKQENSGMMYLSDVEVLEGMTAIEVNQPDENYATVETDNHQPTYYISSAIGSAFQVCSAADQENVEPDDCASSLFLMPNNSSSSASTKLEACSQLNNNCSTNASWHPVSGDVGCGQNEASPAVYYVTIPRDVGVLTEDSVEVTTASGAEPTESHVLRVFQRDGVGTVVSSDDHSTDACKFNFEHEFPSQRAVETNLGSGHVYMLMSVDNVVPCSDATMETEQISVN
jgi:hypothetical protein